MASCNKIPDDFDEPTHRPIIISGPSGVGKSTLCRKLQEAHPDTFYMAVSFTTRKPRLGEVTSNAYDFIPVDAFKNLIRLGAFIEHTEFNGNLYGTAWNEVRYMTVGSKIPLLDIEMEGIKQIKKTQLEARFVFISPPSLEVLEKQLRGRGTEDDESIRRRLARAKDEMDFAATGVHDMIIINDDVEVAFKQLEEFCLAEYSE
ncbi:P-loop containing nucleoside triphosphate hydrolase protein [Plectosphaerella plurivora]|uniref:guanylate kinase n=1 Tax=Plectosphaerella plurivora TaxID=936078 RepID=A0A9P8VLU9_9PEZI|nr:P-loop containing nucleoside triphosphate hydrolase protein [Plectosphaerella plurivora]